jgi:hypothetical protein
MSVAPSAGSAGVWLDDPIIIGTDPSQPFGPQVIGPIVRA